MSFRNSAIFFNKTRPQEIQCIALLPSIENNFVDMFQRSQGSVENTFDWIAAKEFVSEAKNEKKLLKFPC
jgi:hypothetical protein